MTGAHFHLIINHFPLFSILFGTLALAWFILKKSPEILLAACVLFVLGGATAILAVQSGEPAEKMIVDHPEVVKSMIHEHEEAGELALMIALALAAAGVALMVLKKYKPQFLNKASWGVLGFAILSNILMGRAAMYGGVIRHSEIREEGFTPSSEGSSSDELDTDEDMDEGADDMDQDFFEEEPSDKNSGETSKEASEKLKK